MNFDINIKSFGQSKTTLVCRPTAKRLLNTSSVRQIHSKVIKVCHKEIPIGTVALSISLSKSINLGGDFNANGVITVT